MFISDLKYLDNLSNQEEVRGGYSYSGSYSYKTSLGEKYQSYKKYSFSGDKDSQAKFYSSPLYKKYKVYIDQGVSHISGHYWLLPW